MGSNQYETKPATATVADRARVERFGNPTEPATEPAEPGLDELTLDGYTLFRQHCTSHDLDPETVLIEGRAANHQHMAETAFRTVTGLPADGDLAAAYQALTADQPTAVWALAATSMLEHEHVDRLAPRLLGNPECPPELLDALAAAGHAYTRQLVARHPNTPRPALERLLDDESRFVRWEPARREPMEVWLAERLVADPDAQVRDRVAEHLADPTGPWKELLADESRMVVETAATNPRIPADMLDKLSRRPARRNYQVAIGVARNPAATPKILHRLARHTTWDVVDVVAKHPNTHPDDLHKIARRANATMGLSLVRNPNTRTDTLELLTRVRGFRMDDMHLAAYEELDRRRATSAAGPDPS